MSLTPENLPFSIRHPIFYQATSKTFKFGKEQIVSPLIVTIATFGTAWIVASANGSPFSWPVGLLTLFCSAVISIILCFLFNLSKEPLVVLREHQAILNSTLARLQLLESPSKLALPKIAISIREALVEADRQGKFACFLNINVHNETDIETNITEYKLTVKIGDVELRIERLLDISKFELRHVVLELRCRA